MKKAIGYIRVSTDRQTEGSSLENQESRIRAYCSLYGLDLIDIESDLGLTGRSTNRDGFKRLMDRVTNGECDSVVVYSLSRFARNTVDALTNIDIMIKFNTNFHSINEKIDTSSAHGKFFLTIISALAELESNQTSERVRDVARHNKKNLKTYVKAIYGFDNHIKGSMTINESEMAIVKQIKKMAVNEPYRKIAEWLNKNNVPTKYNKTWHASTIKSVLSNDIYDLVS